MLCYNEKLEGPLELHSLQCLDLVFRKNDSVYPSCTPTQHSFLLCKRLLLRLPRLLFRESREGPLFSKPNCSAFVTSTEQQCWADCEGTPAISSSRSIRRGFGVMNPRRNSILSPPKLCCVGTWNPKARGQSSMGRRHGQKCCSCRWRGCSRPWNTNDVIVSMHHGCTMSALHRGFATHPRATTQRTGTVLTSAFAHPYPWMRASPCVFYRTCSKTVCVTVLCPPHGQGVSMNDTSQIPIRAALLPLLSPGRQAEAQLHEHWDSITSQHCLPRPCDSQHVPLGMTMPRAQSV